MERKVHIKNNSSFHLSHRHYSYTESVRKFEHHPFWKASKKKGEHAPTVGRNPDMQSPRFPVCVVCILFV